MPVKKDLLKKFGLVPVKKDFAGFVCGRAFVLLPVKKALHFVLVCIVKRQKRRKNGFLLVKLA
jgi:hypothetical protein